MGMYAEPFPAMWELHLFARSTSPGKFLLRLVVLCSQCFGVGLFCWLSLLAAPFTAKAVNCSFGLFDFVHSELLLVVCSTPGCLFGNHNTGFKWCVVLLKHMVVRQPHGSVLTSFVALTKVRT